MPWPKEYFDIQPFSKNREVEHTTITPARGMAAETE